MQHSMSVYFVTRIKTLFTLTRVDKILMQNGNF